MNQIVSFLQNTATLIDDIPGVYEPEADLENTIAELAMNTVLVSSVTLVILTIIAILFSQKVEKLKMPLFVMMSIVMAGSTIFLVGSTIYLNTNSYSGGPVHWHADMEFWACDNELELRDPTGFLSNKIGTATLHEHDDHRIHLEGVVVDGEIDASLGKFMHVAGGAITDTNMVVPLNDPDVGSIYEDEVDGDGPSDSNPDDLEPYIQNDPDLGRIAVFEDGQSCGSDISDVQVFRYSYNGENKTYEQTKLDNPRDYVIFDDPNVPPGDCIIFEFGPSRDKTDKLCEQYGIRDIDRCEQFGVEPQQREICELTQVGYDDDAATPAEDLPIDPDAVPEDEEVEEFETTESTEGAVHVNPVTEDARIACEQSGSQSSTECREYQEILDNDPGAQAEIDQVTNVEVDESLLVDEEEVN